MADLKKKKNLKIQKNNIYYKYLINIYDYNLK